MVKEPHKSSQADSGKLQVSNVTPDSSPNKNPGTVPCFFVQEYWSLVAVLVNQQGRVIRPVTDCPHLTGNYCIAKCLKRASNLIMKLTTKCWQYRIPNPPAIACHFWYLYISGSPSARRSLMSSSCFQWKYPVDAAQGKYPVDATYDAHGEGMFYSLLRRH